MNRPASSPPNPTVLRVALIGAGARGADWVAALTGSDAAVIGVGLAVVCDLDPDGTGLTLRGSAPATVPRVDDLAGVLALAPDIVVDATSPQARLTIVRAALRAGVHVLCDPPLARDETTVMQLVGAAARAQGLFSVAYLARHRAGVQQLRGLVASAALGRPQTLRVALPTLDGAILHGPLAEAFDAARAILGLDAVSVRCAGRPVEVMFGMQDGVSFELLCGTASESWDLQLEGGTARWDGSAAAIVTTGPALIAVAPVMQGHAAALLDLVTAIRTGGRADPGPRGAAASLAMALAVHRSAKHGGRTEVVMPLGLMSDASASPAARTPRPVLATGEVP